MHSGKPSLKSRNRFRACQLAGVEPLFETYVGTDPLGFVESENLHRRHLTEAQRAMAAAEVATMRQGARTDLSPSGERLPETKGREQAAREFHVGTSSLDRARQVMKKGSPELVKEVKNGNLPVNTALRLASLPKEEQSAIVTSAATPSFRL